MRRAVGSGRGQATVEYAGLLLLVALAFTAVAAGGALPGAKLATTIAAKLLCVVRDGPRCSAPPSDLQRAYGTEIAALLREHAPEVRFEDAEFVSLPVDFRDCRDRSCADTSERGPVGRSFEDHPATAFVRVIDCRGLPTAAAAAGAAAGAGADCEGAGAGNLYLQYWLYYPDSATRPFGAKGYHRDDWESYQVRIGAGGAGEARASSHRGYHHEAGGLSGALNDLGVSGVGPIKSAGPAWGPSNGFVWVSAGSHAGRAAGDDGYFRSVRPEQLRLVPIEPNLRGLSEIGFERGIDPPWLKAAWRDPEHSGT